MQEDHKEYLKFALKMSKFVKKIMLKYFRRDNGEKYKADNTIVTKADTTINSYVIKQVKKHFPLHSVNGEEESFGKSDFVWACDPVDGTAMYARHIPIAVFSIALLNKGEPIVGVVLDPFTNKTYYAVKGEGAFLNGKQIKVNSLGFENMKTMGHIDVWPYWGYDCNDVIKVLSKNTYVLGVGSVTHASMYVATGDFSYVVFGGTKGKNVDIAAAKVIVEEAGGKVTSFKGTNQPYDTDIDGAILTNGVLHDKILEIVKQHAKKVES